jgi:hypothetical protein
MRGQRGKQAAAAVQPAGKAAVVIDVSEHKPRRIPSKKWRVLIKKVWEADPLLCPKFQKEMRIVSLIDDGPRNGGFGVAGAYPIRPKTAGLW